MSRYLLKLLLLLSLSSCSLLKYNVGSNALLSPKKALKSSNKKLTSIKFLQAKAKVSIKDSDIKQNSIELRFEIDNKIWLSAPIGAARALIDIDSLKFYNKIDRTFYKSDISYISNRIGFALDFVSLQKILLGKHIFEMQFSDYADEVLDNYFFKRTIVLNKVPTEFTSLIDKMGNLKEQSLTQNENSFTAKYDSYLKLDKYVVPTKVSFYKDGNEIFKMEIRSIKILKRLNIPFKLPKKYSRIDL